jgi:hypothetical protein
MTRALLAAQALVLSGLMVVVADVYAHKRVEQDGGVNVWGYRGAVALQRKPGDVRVLFVGGTRAYGYGASARDTIPARLEWEVGVRADRPVTVINASRNGASAADFAAIIDQFAGLQSDYVVIHDDLGRAATRPRRSRVSALTGYTPILPLVMEEKGMRWRYGSVAAAYEGRSPAAGLVGRSAGAALQTFGRVLRDLESPLAPAPNVDHRTAVMAAVDAALRHALGVLVVVDPPAGELTTRNRAALIAALDSHEARQKIRVFDLASVGGVDDPDATLDHYSYSALGRHRVAMGVLPVVLEMIRR